MSRVIADISMSLDGYVTAPGADPQHGLGIGGEAIHAWVLDEPRSPIDEAVLARSFDRTGAVVMGRRLYDVVDGPDGWNDEVGYGHDQDQSAAPPCYVLTHQPPAEVRLAARLRFVTGGVADAIGQARAAAGGKDVVVMGGANIIDQALAAGLADELRIHLSPLVLGSGTPLFDLAGPVTLVQRKVTMSPRATHITTRSSGTNSTAPRPGRLPGSIERPEAGHRRHRAEVICARTCSSWPSDARAASYIPGRSSPCQRGIT